MDLIHAIFNVFALFSCVTALYICVGDTQSVSQPFVSVWETHKLCCSPIYLSERHTGGMAAGGGREAVVPTPHPLVSTHTPKAGCKSAPKGVQGGHVEPLGAKSNKKRPLGQGEGHAQTRVYSTVRQTRNY